MAPIAELTETARTIERTRDPSRRIPYPEGEDEVAELARTLDGMLHALDQARSETEATLARQREFVADASHELRTPLTSVLANLELLEEVLEGEQREAAASALRSSRRMRRLVADLLLLARADAGRITRHEPVDVASVVTEAAGELEPVSDGHDITVARPVGRDDLRRPRRAPPARAEPARERAAPHRPGHGGRGLGRARSTARSSSPSRTTARASRRSSTTRSSNASSAATATAPDPPVSASQSSAQSPNRTTATSRSRIRWTAAEPASSCGSPLKPRRSA